MARFLASLILGLMLATCAHAQSCPQTVVKADATTSYPVVNSDNCKLITLSNASAVAVSLAQPGASSNFTATWSATFLNLNDGLVTITPSSSTIDGKAFITLVKYQGVRLTSNGTNYNSSGLSFVSSSLAVPVCPNGVGCLTAATPDIYPVGFPSVIAASTVPVALCKASPAATVTFLVKKWTAGNPASSSTLCTGSISTACALSSCSISATSLAAADGLSVEATEAGADAAAVISITVPIVKQQ